MSVSGRIYGGRHALSSALLAVLCAISPAAFGGLTAVVTAELDGPTLPYHRSATLVVKVECAKGTTVQWPELTGKIKDVDIAADAATLMDAPGEQEVAQRAYHLDAVRPGSYRLPDLDVTLNAGTESESFSLPPLVFRARELTEEEKAAAQGFEESLPISALGPGQGRALWYGAAGLGGVAAAVFLWLFLRRKKPMPVSPPKPAWDVALARLHELRLRNLPIQGQTERYYVDLSAILRYYVEDRFGLRAPEQTTPEFLDIAAQSGLLSEAQQDFLARFLRHSDRVKFARHEPGMAEMEERLAEAEQFVRDTVPGPEPDPKMEGAA